MEKNQCLNCLTNFEGNYCSNCGQKNQAPGIRFKDISEQITSTVLNFESPFFKTFVGLLRHPGQVSRAYISGKRKIYNKPIPFFLLAVAIHLLLAYILSYDPIKATIESTGGQDKMSVVQREASYWMAKNVNYILPVWVLIISLMDKLFFPRSGFKFPERMTHYFFVIAQYILLSTAIIPLTKIDAHFQFTTYLIMIIYLTYAVGDFHKKKIWNAIKSPMLVIISFVLYAALMNTIVITILKNFRS